MAVNETVGINLVADTRSLRTQLKEATQELARLQNTAGASAKEIAGAAKRAAELKDRIGDAKDTIAAFNPDAKFKAFGQSIQGVAGAFAATQGALALVGVESKEVEKQLLKVQGALALSEGLNTVLGSIDGFKNLALVIKTKVISAFSTLKGAIIATGIGALAVILGLVIANFEQVKKVVYNLIPGLEAFTNTVGKLVIKMTDFVGITSEADRQLEKLTINTKNRNAELENEIKLLEASGSTSGAVAQKKKEIIDNEINLLRAKQKTGEKLSNEELQKIQDLNTQKKIIDIQSNKGLIDAAKKKNDDLIKLQEEQNNKFVEKENERIKRLSDLIESGLSPEQLKLKKLKEAYDSDLILFDDNERAKALIKQKYNDDVLKIEKDSLKEQFKDLKINNVLQSNESKSKLERDLRFKTNLGTIIDRYEKKRSESEVQLTQLTQGQKLDILSNAAGMAMRLAGEGTVAGKAFGIAQAVINTYQAANNALATLPPPFSFIAAGTTIAAGLMNVDKIINTPIPTAPGVSDTSGSSRGMASAPIMPSFSMPEATRLDQTSLNTISNVVARAYVVESDISGTQKRIKRIENAARI